MARTFPTSHPQDHAQEPQAGEWAALRGELVTLLDQVESQVARSGRKPAAGYPDLNERLRDLRYQVTEVEPESRQREALRSVKRAVDRFSDRDEPMLSQQQSYAQAPQQAPAAPAPEPVPVHTPANPQDRLRSAIDEIRTRHPEAMPAHQPQGRVVSQPRFDELSGAVTGISSRLERLEGELRSHSKNQTGNVKEIAEQVSQLSHVVELLAGAVGETGQVKRLEGQIAGLARLVAQGPQVDLSVLTKRLDEVSGSVGRLAEIQKSFADRMDDDSTTQQLEDVSATIGRLADMQMQFAHRLENPAVNQRLDEVTGTIGKLADLQRQFAERINDDGLDRRLDDMSTTVGRLSELQELMVQRIENPALSHRIEAISASVGRLSEMQVQLAEKLDRPEMSERLNDVTETIGRLADLQVQFADRVAGATNNQPVLDGVRAIEDGVRNIYDRIDTIERNTQVSPADIDRITGEMARITEAMRSQMQPQGLIELIDELNTRIADIEIRNGNIGGLKEDVASLRAAVVETFEPRFAALESKIDALGTRMSERPDDISVGQLEAQVRQLVARMDQTGETLTGLARMYNQPAEREVLAPDFEALADLVASRTSDAVSRNGAPVTVATTAGLSDAEFGEIEKRVSRVVAAAAKETVRDTSADEFSGMHNGIREVNDRLARLEATLSNRARDFQRIEAAPIVPSLPPDVSAPLAADPVGEVRAPMGRVDAMPKSPAMEAPLTDKPFPAPGPVKAALEAKNGPRKRHPGLGDSATDGNVEAAKREIARPSFDPEAVARPPRPTSSLDVAAKETFTAAAPALAVAPTETDPSAPVSTNTFVAAARRASQRQAATKQAAAPTSLIARALAGFQAGKTAEDKEKPTTDKVADEPRRLAGDKKVRTERKPQKVVAEAAPVVPAADVATPVSAEAGEVEGKESFLTRHRKPILLAAAVVALALLTLNLVTQRLAEGEVAPLPVTPVVAPAEPVAPLTTGEAKDELPFTADPAVAAATLGNTPRVIPLVDSLATTASVDPGAARSFTPNAETPALPRAFTATDQPIGDAVKPDTAVAALADLPTHIVPLEGKQPVAAVKVELPPDNVGPEPLRQAAANGDARAQFEIAAIYTEGRAVAEDLQAAAVWYERSAAQGFAPAQYRLGNLYENGRGVAKDLQQGKLWYQRAAEAGNRMSMHNLAALYAGGELGKQEFESAARWFEQAADRGLRDSQFNLGMLYARGLGVTQDLEKSYKWFALAASSGDPDAGKARDDVARSLDAAAVDRLTGEIAAWKPIAIDLAANFAPIGTWSGDFDPGATIDNPDVIKSVQMALNVLGYDVGTPDGLIGPKTADAIKSFEKATGMSEIGAINPRLLAVLGSQPI